MGKEVIKKNSSTISNMFFFGIIPIVISLPITNFLNDWYYKFQMSVFSSDNTLLFIYSKVSDSIIFLSPYMIAFCIMLSIKRISSIQIMKVNIFSVIAIVILIVSTFTLACKFFECVDINKDGIQVRSSMFFTNKNYTWSDVRSAEVSYERGGWKNNIEITYDIYLNDGTILNARNSKDFSSNIVNLDNFIKNENIKIIRSNIQASDYSDFEYRFKDDGMKVVLQILNK